jgi:RNA polymerase sigma-70 factor (ECF subfamily)
MDDAELLKKIAKGDSKCFSILLEKYKSKVFGTCYYLMGEKSLAEDLAQETWIRVVNSANEYQPIAPVIAWILRIARNACYNELRTRNRWSELSPEEENQVVNEQLSAEEVLSGIEDESRLKKAMIELPPQQKMALLMVVQEEKSHAEVAKELGCSTGAVKVLLFRARENLKKRMEES